VTDDRDRIFAILELSRDAQQLGIVPNYELSTEDLYVNVARALLLRRRRFRVLSLCQKNKKYSRLPSWVPDWSSLAGPELAWPHVGDVMEECPCYDDFTPSKGLDLRDFPVQSKDQRRLRLHALMVDFVESTGKSYSQIAAQVIPDREPNRLPCAQRSWILALASLQRNYRQKRLNKVCEDHNNAEEQAVIDRKRLFITAFADRGLTDMALEEYDIPRPSTCIIAEQFFEDSLVEDEDAWICSLYAWYIERAAQCRRPFITSRGYIGIGPTNVAVGHQIAIIVGADVPFVLEESNDKSWRLIGESYVNGIMYGEEARDSARVQEIEIH